LYGIWVVTNFTVDGASLPPPTAQRDRWRRLIIDDPDRLSYQRMDDVIVTRSAAIDAHAITLTNAPLSKLTIDRTGPDGLSLTGQVDGHTVSMTLRRLDLDSLPLYRNRFHWVQEYPDIPSEY
jgi:hypothetical protein